MVLEARRSVEDAEALYQEQVEKDVQNGGALRRLVALRGGAGDKHAAVEHLLAYLDTHMTDWSAWEELAELYLQVHWGEGLWAWALGHLWEDVCAEKWGPRCRWLEPLHVSP